MKIFAAVLLAAALPLAAADVVFLHGQVEMVDHLAQLPDCAPGVK
jgi:hypothetical protein